MYISGAWSLQGAYTNTFPLSVLEDFGSFEASKAYRFKLNIINGAGSFTLNEQATVFLAQKTWEDFD